MTREEAITFLQDIKTSLEFLQTHYAQLQHDKDQQRQQAKVSQLLTFVLQLRFPSRFVPKFVVAAHVQYS